MLLRSRSRLIPPALLALLLSLASAAPAAASLIIEWKSAASANDRHHLNTTSALAARGVTSLRPMFPAHTAPNDPLAVFWLADPAPGTAPETALEALRLEPAIRSVTEDLVMPLSDCLPDDPYFAHAHPDSQQWPLDRNPVGPDLDALEAWNVTPGDPDVVIAILDSGVDWHHPDLGPADSPDGAVRMNEAERNGTPGVDDDGNGFIDDLRGWDFVDVAAIAGYDPNRVAVGEDGLGTDNDPVDFFGHGTFIAGVIAARADNGIGMVGAAPGCRILPLRVAWRENPNNGVVSMAFCAQAIVYAADNGARVLNCSWLSDETAPLAAALDYAIGVKKVVVVDAAGNGGLLTTQSRNYLSRRGDGIEVAAVNREGIVAAETSIGTWIEVSAPGVGLLSLARTGGASLYRIEPGGATSFAAPFVSAAAGLILSAEPDLEPAAVRGRITATATPIDHIGPNPFYAGKLGAGLVNLAAAVGAAARAPRLAAGSGVTLPPAVLENGDFVFIDRTAVFHRLGAPGDADSALLLASSFVSGFASWIEAGAAYHAVTFRSGHVLVLNGAGVPEPGWPRPTGRPVFGSPVVVDTGSGVMILVAGTDGLLYGWDRQGRARPGFPRALPGPAVASPAAGDIDGDGGLDIAVVTSDGITVFDEFGAVRSAARTAFAGAGHFSPVLADMDGDGLLEIVMAGAEVIYAFNNDGVIEAGSWPVSLASSLAAPPSAADLDGDGAAEILVPLADSSVIVLNGDGTVRPGWPVLLGSAPAGEVLALPEGDGSSSIVTVTTVGGCVERFRPDGVRAASGTKRHNSAVAAPAAAGTTTLWLADNEGTIRRYESPEPEEVEPGRSWRMAGGNAGRTRSLPPTTTPAAPEGIAPAITLVLSPNPSRLETVSIRFRLESGGEGRLDLFDVQGRRIRRLFDGPLPAGETILAWDGRDERGRPVPAGIYSYRLSAASWRATGRLIRLR